MNYRSPITKHPVRAVAVVGCLVLLLGYGGLLLGGDASPFALGFFVFYGAILGWYSVGLALASGFVSFRWWLATAVLPLGSMAILAVWMASRSETVLGWWFGLISRVAVLVMVSWLSAGCLIAMTGWWSHVLHRRSSGASGCEKSDPTLVK